jgi:adenylate cyclase
MTEMSTARDNPDSLRISAAIDWLVAGARSAAKSEDVLAELCKQLLVAGLPLWRVAVFVRTLHPLVMGRSFVWRPSTAVVVSQAPHAMLDGDEFLTSPVARLYATGEKIRRRLADPECPDDFPLLASLRAEGVTDYLALPLLFTNAEIHAATFTTRQACGFSDQQAMALESLARPLARVAEVRALRASAVSLLNAYVGRDAGERILSGQIRRGEVEKIRAAIWLSDMRGFTRRADSAPAEALLDLLNRFFDRLVPAIEAEGGEVLKFMGDGLLAIFRFADPSASAEICRRALRAALAAEAEVKGLSDDIVASGGEPLRFGVALHLGEALYGNIGAGARLDFTCIGPAINLAARLEKIAAQQGRVVVASAAFAAEAPEQFEEIGEYELAGFRERQTVFIPRVPPADASPTSHANPAGRDVSKDRIV